MSQCHWCGNPLFPSFECQESGGFEEYFNNKDANSQSEVKE